MTFKTVQPGDPSWLVDAFAHLGLAEVPGPAHNKLIVEMFGELGFPVSDDETSWCAVFANWLAKRSDLPVTGSMAARSFLDWGVDATAEPQRGDFVVIKRGTEAWQGHVFLWLAEVGDLVWGIGGNQGKVGAVTVAKFAKSSVLGIRRPQLRPAAAPPASTWPAEQVTAVQQALWENGYKQVGMIDGEYGRDTRAAIVAFELDHGLELKGEPTVDILARILAAAKKPIGPARAEATPADVREAAPEAKATWIAKLVALWGFIGSALTGVFAWVSDNIAGAKTLAQPLLDLAGDVPVWLYVAVLAVALLAVWWRARAAEHQVVAAFRSGERR